MSRRIAWQTSSASSRGRFRIYGRAKLTRPSARPLAVELLEERVVLSEVKIAFIGDQGNGSSADAVLNLIKSEGADMVIHSGDFDYGSDPDAFDGRITRILGASYPYFASVGNHDTGAWTGYRQKLTDRLARVQGASCSGEYGVNAACTYKGIFFILSGVGTKGSGHEAYIRDQLAADNSTWSICSWHKDQNAMQVGGKGDEVGWGAYEACREGGAIIATAHEHSYERTKTLVDMTHQTVDSTCASATSVCVDPGRTFTFVSGLGGKSIRNQDRCLPTTPPYGCNHEWASIYTSDQNAQFGALFIVFNFGGDPLKAHGYFKNVSGDVIDEFDVSTGSGGAATPGITVTPTSGLVTTEAGGTATFTVVLNTQPTANVTIPVSSSNTAEGTVSPASLTFTSANWNTAQTVTVSGVDDAVDDGDITYSIRTDPATSGDADYNGVNASDVSVKNADDDTAGITVSPTSGLTTTEAGGTATFTIVLTSEPTADVNIGLASSDGGEGTVSPTLLNFTPANWNTAQTVTLTGVDDAEDDDDIAYTIVAAAAVSNDPKYTGLDPADVSATNVDNDVTITTFLFSLTANGTVVSGNGSRLSVANEDIVAFDGTNFSLFFDGSDVALANLTLDAFSVISSTELLMSFTKSGSIPGIPGTVDDSDIVKFTATQLGEQTSGSFELLFDGSDVGLTKGGEDVDAVELLSNGHLLLSTTGSFSVPGMSATVSGKGEDVIEFTPSALGMDTAGAFALFFKGRDAGLSGGNENVDALALDRSGRLYLSTSGTFSVPAGTGALTGAREDVFRIAPTSGTHDAVLFFDGSLFGLGKNNISAIDIAVDAVVAEFQGIALARSLMDDRAII